MLDLSEKLLSFFIDDATYLFLVHCGLLLLMFLCLEMKILIVRMCEIQLLPFWNGQKRCEVFLVANTDVILITVDKVEMIIIAGMHRWKFVNLKESFDKLIISKSFKREQFSMLSFVDNFQAVL